MGTREVVESNIKQIGELSYQIYIEELETAALSEGIVIPDYFHTISFKMTYLNGFLDGMNKGIEIQKNITEARNQNSR